MKTKPQMSAGDKFRDNMIQIDIRRRKAQAAALAHLNEARVADGFKPLKRIEPMWWSIHGAEWIAKVQP